MSIHCKVQMKGLYPHGYVRVLRLVPPRESHAQASKPLFPSVSRISSVVSLGRHGIIPIYPLGEPGDTNPVEFYPAHPFPVAVPACDRHASLQPGCVKRNPVAGLVRIRDDRYLDSCSEEDRFVANRGSHKVGITSNEFLTL